MPTWLHRTQHNCVEVYERPGYRWLGEVWRHKRRCYQPYLYTNQQLTPLDDTYETQREAVAALVEAAQP